MEYPASLWREFSLRIILCTNNANYWTSVKSFPNMPVWFWGKDGADKYFNSYFARFDGMLILRPFQLRAKRPN